MDAQLTNSNSKVISYLALAISIVFGIAGQLLMKSTMSGRFDGSFTQPFLLQLVLAISVYSFGVINWIVALRSVKLSIAYPLTSLNYIGILLGSHYFFNETITFSRIVGVLLIFIGVLLVAIPLTTQPIPLDR